MSLSNGRETPQNLKKNEIRRGRFNDNTSNYYYIDIVKDEEGDIVLDFIRGGGIDNKYNFNLEFFLFYFNIY